MMQRLTGALTSFDGIASRNCSNAHQAALLAHARLQCSARRQCIISTFFGQAWWWLVVQVHGVSCISSLRHASEPSNRTATTSTGATGNIQCASALQAELTNDLNTSSMTLLHHHAQDQPPSPSHHPCTRSHHSSLLVIIEAAALLQRFVTAPVKSSSRIWDCFHVDDAKQIEGVNVLRSGAVAASAVAASVAATAGSVNRRRVCSCARG